MGHAASIFTLKTTVWVLISMEISSLTCLRSSIPDLHFKLYINSSVIDTNGELNKCVTPMLIYILHKTRCLQRPNNISNVNEWWKVLFPSQKFKWPPWWYCHWQYESSEASSCMTFHTNFIKLPSCLTVITCKYWPSHLLPKKLKL